jgi:NAD(P)-dependent dehydrogenase (short-subunit alcohol dehydrogenase family)/aryl carrier-like protein
MVEAMADSAEPLVAYRGDARWLRAYDSLPYGLAQIAPPVLRDRGVYLIVGGLGAIGLTIAEYLARAVCARLILVARSPFPPRSQWDDCLDDDCAAPDVADKIRTIRKLEEFGGEVLICQADVCDGAAMARVVEAATQAFGPVAGVVHAAGVSGSALIQDHSPDAMRRTLAPKVQGAAVLTQLFENRQLDFLVFFSSTLGYLGGMGQADYAAASAFLDMYAEWHRLNCATRTTSIAWTSWRDVGMAAPVVQQHVLDCSNDWRVAEHRLGGRGVLPGTAYIELIVQTFRRRVNRQPMEIRDVMLLRPWFAPESGRGEVETRLLRQVGDRFTVEIVDRATGVRHATAMLSSLSVEEPQRVEVSDILARCPNQIPIGSPETGATAVERQLWLGERWHCLQRVQSGKDEAVACLELDAKFAGDVESHPLHPALVDVATSCVLHRFGDGPYVPFSCRRIRFYRSLPRQMIAHLKWQPGTSVSDRPVSVDVSICDLAGTRLVELEGYAFVRAGSRSLTAATSAPENPVERLQEENRGISAKQAIEAFVRILANDPPSRVIVSRDPIAEPGHDNDDRDAAAKEIRNEPATSFHARPALSTELVMATGRVERQIVEAWQELLGIAPIGIHDNFMELGGDSIVALQIIARCDAVGIHLTPVQFFDHPTIAELARVAEQRDESVATTTGAPGDATGEAEKFPLAKLRPGDLEKLYAEFGSSE